MRQGDNFVSRGRAFVNWLLLFIIIGSIGGTVYADHHSKSDSDITETKAITNDDDEEADQVYINFDKKKARLNSDGVAPMKIIVSPNTKVKIVGHDTGKVYKTFKAEKSDGPVTIKYNFEYAAKYDIIATRGDKKVKKTITIKEQKNDSSSSSSSSVTSSSSSSSSSSSHSSSHSSTVIPITVGTVMLAEAITLEHLIMTVVAVTVVIQAVAATPHPIPITVVAILVAVVPLVTNQRSVLNRLLVTNNYVFR